MMDGDVHDRSWFRLLAGFFKWLRLVKVWDGRRTATVGYVRGMELLLLRGMKRGGGPSQ